MSINNISLDILLKDGIICQKRTGKNKQFTFLYNNEIIKGPYTEEKANKIKQKFEKLKSWNTDYLIYPLEFIKDNNDIVFIKYPNVGIKNNFTIETYKESFSEYTCNLMTSRVGLEKVSDLITKPENKWLFNFSTTIAITLIKEVLLCIGDRGLFNIIADKETHKIYIIDVDENSEIIRDSDTFYCSKDMKSSYKDVWKDNIDVEEVLNRLEKDIPRNDKNESYHEVITMFKKYHKEKIVTGENNFTNLLIPADDKIINNIGKMSFNRFSSTTYSGYKTDVVKSSLQKYIRRCIKNKALISTFELYRMGEVEGGDPLVSNLYNRLSVISTEDIGPANINLALSTINFVLSKNRDKNRLFNLVGLLADSKKTRVLSHIWRMYDTGDGRRNGKAACINIKTINEITNPSLRKLVWYDEDPTVIIKYAEMFNKELGEKDINCVYWLSTFMSISEGLKIKKRNRRTNPMQIIFDILQNFLHESVYEILYKAYFTFSETRPFLMLAVWLAVYETKQEYELINIDNTILEDEEKVLDGLMIGDYNVEYKIEDFIIDMHTKEGRDKGMDRKNFIEEGMKVCNEDERFKKGMFKIMEEIYRM